MQRLESNNTNRDFIRTPEIKFQHTRSRWGTRHPGSIAMPWVADSHFPSQVNLDSFPAVCADALLSYTVTVRVARHPLRGPLTGGISVARQSRIFLLPLLRMSRTHRSDERHRLSRGQFEHASVPFGFPNGPWGILPVGNPIGEHERKD